MSVGITQAEPTTRPERSAFAEGFPPLESGDRMNREEFHRRYEAMPHIQKAELVEGVVFVSSPIRYKYHGRQHGYVLTWLGVYVASTPAIDVGGNASVFLDDINEPQPDGVLFVQPECGGQVKIDVRGYILGIPISPRRSRPAASATTCMTSSMPMLATEFANTSSGACTIKRSTGFSCAKDGTNLSHWVRTGSCAVAFFPGFGWMPPRCCVATLPPSWKLLGRACALRNTRNSSPD